MRLGNKRHLLRARPLLSTPALEPLCNRVVDLSRSELEVADAVVSTFNELRLASIAEAREALELVGEFDLDSLLEQGADAWNALSENVAEVICFDSALIGLADAVELAVTDAFARLRELVQADVSALRDLTTSWKEL